MERSRSTLLQPHQHSHSHTHHRELSRTLDQRMQYNDSDLDSDFNTRSLNLGIHVCLNGSIVQVNGIHEHKAPGRMERRVDLPNTGKVTATVTSPTVTSPSTSRKKNGKIAVDLRLEIDVDNIDDAPVEASAARGAEASARAPGTIPSSKGGTAGYGSGYDSGYYDYTGRILASGIVVEEIPEEEVAPMQDMDNSSKNKKKSRTDIRKQRAKKLKGTVEKECNLDRRRASIALETIRNTVAPNLARRFSIANDEEALKLSSSESEVELNDQNAEQLDTLIMLHKLKKFLKQHVPADRREELLQRKLAGPDDLASITTEDCERSGEVTPKVRSEAGGITPIEVSPQHSPEHRRARMKKQNAVENMSRPPNITIPSIEVQDVNDRSRTVLEPKSPTKSDTIKPGLLKPAFKMDLGSISDTDDVFTVDATSTPKSKRKQMARTESIKVDDEQSAGIVYDIKDVSEITPEQLEDMGIELKEGEVLRYKTVLILDDDENVEGEHHPHLIPLADDNDGVTDTEIEAITKEAEKIVSPNKLNFRRSRAMTTLSPFSVGSRGIIQRSASCPGESPPRTPVLTHDTYLRFFESSRGVTQTDDENTPVEKVYHKVIEDLDAIQLEKHAKGEDTSGLAGYHKFYLRNHQHSISSDTEDPVFVYPDIPERKERPRSRIELKQEELAKKMNKDAQKNTNKPRPLNTQQRPFSVSSFSDVTRAYDMRVEQRNTQSERPVSASILFPVNSDKDAKEKLESDDETKISAVGKRWGSTQDSTGYCSDSTPKYYSGSETSKRDVPSPRLDKGTIDELGLRSRVSTKFRNEENIVKPSHASELTTQDNDEDVVELRQGRSPNRKQHISAPVTDTRRGSEDWFSSSFSNDNDLNLPKQHCDRDHSPLRDEDNDWFFTSKPGDAGMNTNNNNSNRCRPNSLDLNFRGKIDTPIRKKLEQNTPIRKKLEQSTPIRKKLEQNTVINNGPSVEDQLAAICDGYDTFQRKEIPRHGSSSQNARSPSPSKPVVHQRDAPPHAGHAPKSPTAGLRDQLNSVPPVMLRQKSSYEEPVIKRSPTPKSLQASPSTPDPFKASPSTQDPFKTSPSTSDPFLPSPSSPDPFIDYRSRNPSPRMQIRPQSLQQNQSPTPFQSGSPGSFQHLPTKSYEQPQYAQTPPSFTRKSDYIPARSYGNRLDSDVFEDEGHLSDSCRRDAYRQSRCDSGYTSVGDSLSRTATLTSETSRPSVDKAILDLMYDDEYGSDDEVLRQRCLDVFKTWHHEDVVNKQFNKLVRFRNRRPSLAKDGFKIMENTYRSSESTSDTSRSGSRTDSPRGNLYN